MEIIFELLFQLVFEVILETLFHLGWEATSTTMRNPVGRITAGAVVGLGLGVAWGVHVAGTGRTVTPTSLYVCVALAVGSAAVAVARQLQEPAPGDEASGTTASPRDDRIWQWPWHWPSDRFVGFALLNMALALGIAIGFRPPT